MKKIILATIISTALLTGCSSIISQSNYAVAIDSNPTGANFSITNKAGQRVQNGVTPATVTLKSSAGYFKGESYTVVLNKAGYSEKTYLLTSTIDGWYFGNILLGGIIGMLIVDPATGAMYNLPDRVDISLNQSVSSIQSDTITIATLDSLTDEQIDRLERLR
ncbi:MAG: hypothetical protein COC19_04360 [SAR86 cluster bacterium]|uniref:PEGA domain-containing protein n=1 Tax=SAR86 cluster bacterium TaxID=2030880 RepID=A0A2A4MPQ4_9GAMM|nr:MAG: hypothetical protein COC19_04360 [SAR86 cluster bacterium]